jgi:hypothetical protein
MKKETLLMQQEEAKKLTEAISTYQRQKQTQEEHAAILHKEIEAQQQQLQENKTQSPRIKDSQILTEIISLRKQNQQQQHENEILSHQVNFSLFFLFLTISSLCDTNFLFSLFFVHYNRFNKLKRDIVGVFGLERKHARICTTNMTSLVERTNKH